MIIIREHVCFHLERLSATQLRAIRNAVRYRH